ncbi:CAP domain-containing protein [Filomicrobium sp.]|uniref:CAP domain-containing protein n=1 Tax=Filomicrobium sp. TaxID=2024831 RepID=UPI002584619E|nr:CAP domain-containing protein [Filomicrobium sp.]MCV0369485.1 CAP domain-containing protein [Filomicrobium sp.]
MTPVAPDVPAVEVQIIEMTNAYRAKNSLGAVHRNAALDKAARAYAEYLSRTNTFAHDADGRQPSARAEAAGYTYCQIAENLAMALDSRGFTTSALANQAVEGWIKSPSHRKNLLAPYVKEIGVAVTRVPDKHPKYVSVQLFGRPTSEMYAFRISNRARQSVDYTFGGETHEIGPGYSVQHKTCEPGVIAFDIAGKSAGKVQSRYTAADGQSYRLSQDRSGQIRIEIEPVSGR